MIELSRFSPSRLALSYVALSVLVLALFAIPLWYAWSVNLSTFKEYVHTDDVQRMADVFEREGPTGLAAAIEAARYPRDEIVVLADPSKSRLAGNLPAWPAQVPDFPGTYGLVIGVGGSSMRIVASHTTLPGGYHLLVGRESARFQSLVDYFWFGIAAATVIVLMFGAIVGWLMRRALLSRRRAEQALQQAHQDLERLVAQRTEQLQRSNESLRRSEAYLAEAQQLARVGSFGIKVESGELVCSEETMRIAAFEPGSRPTLDDALARVHPEDRPRIQAVLQEGLRDRSLLEYEHRLLLPDGSIKYVHVVAHTIQDASGAPEFVGAVVDITEQKKSRDALHAAKARFEGIVEIADDAIISVDSAQRILLFNRGAEKIFGYSQQEIIGGPLDVILPTRFASAHRVHLEEFARSPDIARVMGQRREVFGVRKGGQEFPAEASISKLDLGGELVFTVILRDVTDRRQAEEARKRAEALLAGEKRLLEVIAKGSPLAATLDGLCRLAQEIDCDALVSILLLDRKGERFVHGAAPSLPDSYIAEIDGLPIGLGVGPCGAAAYGNKQVIASDLAADERWPEYRPIALAHGLRACWSTPIGSSEGKVLGTFAIYSREPRSPTPQQQSQIEQLTQLASIAIERSQAMDALRRSEEGYALAMEASGEGHWDWDIPSDKIYVSPLLLDICGLPPEITFVNRSEWVDRFPFYPGERTMYEQAVAEHFAGKTARLDMDLRILPRGETRWIHLTGRCSRDDSGKPIRWAGSVTDVTARKRVEDELRARQEMLDLAQKAARAVAFEWRIGAGDGENRWSQDLEAMYGIAPGSYDGAYESWKKLVYPEDWPSVRAAIKAAQASGDVSAEYRVVHSGGAIRWLQAKGRMFFDNAGKPTRIVGFMLDVTDRHLAEEELRRMEQQLRQAQRLEGMGTLAGGIAHDFNNLLGAILGYGEMALRDAPTGSRLRRDVESILIAGERGRALVDRVLAFSRSGVGERVPVHVEHVVRETLALFAAKVPREIAIEERLDAGQAAVMGDATQIHQVLMNLVTNAVQAMPSGGTLRVALGRVSFDAPRIAATGVIAAGDHVVLEVADSGSGIEPKILERIFDPFFTTKEAGVGTGLGLSLVHGIVTGLGGVIGVATSVGKGSTFTVYLPRAGNVARAGKLEKRAEPRARRGAHGRILVVDDEAPLVKLVTENLTELGYTTVGFTASAAALAAFLADPFQFDAVITDESMPGTSGAELIRQMRAVRPTMPILLVSGYLSAAVVQRATEAGATEVLKKPLPAGQLAAALDRVLHARRAPPADEVGPAPPGRRMPPQSRRPRTSPSRARSPRRR